MRRLAVAALPVVLVACVVDGQRMPEPGGPTLVMDITNASADEVAVGYEFDAPNMSGTGETLAMPCRREAMPIGTISGTYRIKVAGDTVLEQSVPPAAGPDAFLVVRIGIDPDGEVEVAAPVVVLEPPNASAALPGCGGT
jgi:hypothetical protein